MRAALGDEDGDLERSTAHEIFPEQGRNEDTPERQPVAAAHGQAQLGTRAARRA